jgi:hypothetical protein
MTSKEFDLAPVLSVATGIGVSEFSDFHDLLNFMSNRCLPKRMLAMALNVCQPYVLAQYPHFISLRSTAPKGRGKEACLMWVGTQKIRFGNTAQIKAIPPQKWNEAELAFLRDGNTDLAFVRRTRYNMGR